MPTRHPHRIAGRRRPARHGPTTARRNLVDCEALPTPITRPTKRHSLASAPRTTIRRSVSAESPRARWAETCAAGICTPSDRPARSRLAVRQPAPLPGIMHGIRRNGTSSWSGGQRRRCCLQVVGTSPVRGRGRVLGGSGTNPRSTPTMCTGLGRTSRTRGRTGRTARTGNPGQGTSAGRDRSRRTQTPA